LNEVGRREKGEDGKVRRWDAPIADWNQLNQLNQPNQLNQLNPGAKLMPLAEVETRLFSLPDGRALARSIAKCQW